MELNIDALVGPTHHYAGLAKGNLASAAHANTISNPKAAALEGLAKMKQLMRLGIPQAVLPPHDRPDIQTLRQAGFAGSDAEVLAAAYKTNPTLLAAASSASAMWAANSATVSRDADGQIHFTPANLASSIHRAIETETTARLLKTIFADTSLFVHHEPLPAALRDEGAANHTRLCTDYDQSGVEMFVYGDDENATSQPARFPARQMRQASVAIAEHHGLDAERTLYAQQHPDAIDAGVFHNDVIAVGDRDLFFCHELAYVNQRDVIDELKCKFERCCSRKLCVVEVLEDEVSLQDAVATYLFNSQIVRTRDGRTVLIAPQDCAQHLAVKSYVESLDVFDEVMYVNVRQSMSNGGGPACLRLRVAMNEAQLGSVHCGVMLNEALYEKLTQWAGQYYRDTLCLDDLRDVKLLEESRAALDELTRLLDLGAVYAFQR